MYLDFRFYIQNLSYIFFEFFPISSIIVFLFLVIYFKFTNYAEKWFFNKLIFFKILWIFIKPEWIFLFDIWKIFLADARHIINKEYINYCKSRPQMTWKLKIVIFNLWILWLCHFQKLIITIFNFHVIYGRDLQ